MYHKSRSEQSGSLIHNVEFCLTIAESKEHNAKGGFGIKVIDGGVSHTTGNENHNKYLLYIQWILRIRNSIFTQKERNIYFIAFLYIPEKSIGDFK